MYFDGCEGTVGGDTEDGAEMSGLEIILLGEEVNEFALADTSMGLYSEITLAFVGE